MLYDKKWDKPAEPVEVKPIEWWRQTLLDAADLLMKDGWCQDYGKRGRKRCAEQAIVDAARGSYAFSAAQARLHAFLLRSFPESFSIPEWNDHPLRTQEQVIRTMREAAKS